MTRALIWKELREQGTVSIALLVMGCAILVAASVLLDAGDAGKATDLRSVIVAGRLGLVLLVMTAGTVAGGTLFAGEREAGTLTFLDHLPGTRLGVWWRKMTAGAWLAAVSGAALFAAAFALGLLGARENLLGWAFLTAAVTLASFGWGALGSTLARTSLAACGFAVVLGLVAAVVVMPAFMMLIGAVKRLNDGYLSAAEELDVLEYALMATSFTLIALPIPASAWIFTAPDRSRLLAGAPVAVPGVRGAARRTLAALPSRWSLGFRRLLWLSVRQLRVPAAALGALAILAGCSMVPDESLPTIVWPAISLIAGVLCGVVTLTDEQGTQATRFWGDRRLPVGRVWLAKAAAGAALTLFVVLMLMVPLILAGVFGQPSGGTFFARLFRTGLFAEEGFPVLTYLLVWPAYGFAAGHLFAILFRKTLVAGAAALMVAGTLAGLWLPSLLSGGLHLWQPLVPLLLLLLTARLMAWPWATEGIGTRGPLRRLALGLATVLLAAAGGIGWRVGEVSALDEPDRKLRTAKRLVAVTGIGWGGGEGTYLDEDIRFAKELPTYDDKQAGRDYRRAVSMFEDTGVTVLSAVPDEPLLPVVQWDHLNDSQQPKGYAYRIRRTLEVGWPADRPDLDDWTDKAFATGWDRLFFDAAKKPTGVLEDPNDMTYATPLKNLDAFQKMAPLFLARGLQKQARGDPAAFVEVLDAWLAAVRTVRNNSVLVSVNYGRVFEAMAYQALDRWLERLDGRPDLLRRALQVVRDHEARPPFDPQTVRLAQQVVVRNGVDFPSRWAARYLDELRPGGYRRSWESSGTVSVASETEANFVGFAWAVPWEKERHRRAVGLGNVPGGEVQQIQYLDGLPGMMALIRYPTFVANRSLTEYENTILAPRRAAVLKLALRAYEAEKGGLPRALTELVPAYLPAVPEDPYEAGKPFRYRVSAGETIEYERDMGATPPPANLPPGRTPVTLSAARITAVAGAAGGGVCWPLEPEWMGPPPPPPGLDRPFANEQIEAVAAAAGAGVFWPGLNVWFDDPDSPASAVPYGSFGGAPGGMGGPIPGPAVVPGQELWPWQFSTSREVATVPAGQGILWSVGPDRVDDRAALATGPGAAYSRQSGDLVYLVPRPPKKR